MTQRISKFLSHAGICSRRQAEQLILEGRIKINGQILSTPATLVNEKSITEVDGKLVTKPDSIRVWIYYKPLGYITSHSDPEGRPTIFQDIQSRHHMPRVISVGRLDLNSEGLILLTNNGDFSRKAELPQTGWARCYKVRVFGQLDITALKELQEGITIEGIRYGSIDIEVLEPSLAKTNHWLIVTLYEGKNREIRRVMNYLDLQVNRLIRQSYGPFKIGHLKKGEILEVSPKKITEILKSLSL